MRISAWIVLCIALMLTGPADAQGTNGRPRPFETGYFPGYEQPRVVASTASLEISTDDRTLPVAYPVDAQLVRTVMVKNTSSSPVRANLSQSITITPLVPELFLVHPQPGVLYLDPGETYPVRIQYLIPIDSQAPPWSKGDHVSVSMSLTIQEQSVVTGLDVGSAVNVTLPHDISVVRRINAGPFDPDPTPNATISGTVRHADTRVPYANTGLIVDSASASQHIQTDASGHYTAQVFAYKRTGGEPDWREFTLWMDNSDHALDGMPLVIAKAGETTTFDYLAPTARTMATYTNTGSIQLGLAAYAWDASADGSVMAAVPFHSGLNPDVVAPRSFLDVFTSTGTLLWRYPLNGETPAIDVSDDGQYIVTTRRPVSELGKPLVTGGEAILLNRSGELLRTFPVGTRSRSPWGPEYRDVRYTEVRLSRDNRYLALGDGEGGLALVETATGKELWRTFLKGQVRRIDFDANDARLFASAGDGYLRAFDLAGNQLWKTWVDAWLVGLDISAHYIIASSKAARQGLHLINKVTGTTVWSYQVEQIGMDVRISPDETFVWYGTFAGGGFWLPNNAIFSIDGMPIWQLARADRSAADAGTISANSELIAYARGCTVNVSDRNGRPVYRSPVLGGFNDADCAGQYNHMMWMSGDGKHMVAALGPRDVSTVGGSLYFFNAEATVPVFTAQPTNQSVSAGGSVTFAAASSTPAPIYQWQVSTDGGVAWTNLTDGEQYSGTNTANLTVTSASAAMSGYQYHLMATNAVVWTNSNVATLTVLGADAISVSAGWNLLGNAAALGFDVASHLGDATKVNSVWKWLSDSAKWALYIPALAGAALRDYALAHGYETLNMVEGGEGFWVNAKTPFTLQLPTGTAVTDASFQHMGSGWHLISTGNTETPGDFNLGLSATPSGAGAIPKNIESLWAWDNAQSRWYFYAPSLVAQQGTALADYISARGYLNFTAAGKKLGPGVGFWVYKP